MKTTTPSPLFRFAPQSCLGVLIGIGVLSIGVLATPVYANDDAPPEVMAAETCMPVKGLRETLVKMASLKDSRRDTVRGDMSIAFEMKDGEVMPERQELRDGGVVTELEFDAYHRSIGLTPLLLEASDGAEICNVDPAREGRRRDARGYTVSFGMGVRYIETPGIHSIDLIQDGLKDGRAHWKKMAGAMGFMVPKFDHIAVATDADGPPPRVVAIRDGVAVSALEGEIYDGARMIDLDDLKALGADSVRIDADNYRLSPSPSAKIVARFSGD